MLPKVMSPSEVGWVEGILRSRHPDLPLVPMVETARGLAAAEEIATSSPLIACVFFGGIDLSSELGCVAEWSSLLYARSRVVHAGALAGVGVLDTPYMDVADLEGLAKEARAIRRLGFTGKAAIHPSQVPVIQDAFSPSDAEVKWALRIVQAYEQKQRWCAPRGGEVDRAPCHLGGSADPGDRGSSSERVSGLILL